MLPNLPYRNGGRAGRVEGHTHSAATGQTIAGLGLAIGRQGEGRGLGVTGSTASRTCRISKRRRRVGGRSLGRIREIVHGADLTQGV